MNLSAPFFLNDITRTLDAKYNPNQPRVPRGNSDGGQWTDGAGGGLPRGKPSTALKPQRKPPHLTAPKTPRIRPALSAEELARFNRNAPEGTPPEDLEIDPASGLPRWYVGGAVAPSASPLDAIGGAGALRTAGSLAKTTVTEATAVVRVLRARYSNMRAAEESIKKIRKAADSIEELLGGIPDRTAFKNNGDMVLIKGDTKIRFDIVKFGNGKEARPHFQIEKRTSPPGARKEQWEDIGEHWYDFQDSRLYIKE